MMEIEKIFIIVDGYSTGAQLPSVIARYGYRCIHVQSLPEIPSVYSASFRPNDYVCNIVHRGELETTVEAIRAYQPSFVLAGTESGVELADSLGVTLGFEVNDPSLSRARRDKFEMNEAVRRSGIRTVDHFKSYDCGSVLAWANDHGLPVVVKPPKSAGTDSVTFCYSLDDVQRAFDAIFQKKNQLSQINDYVLVQSFLEGDEYFVNSVSLDGFHYITEIWRVKKKKVKNAAYIYDMSVLLPGNGELQETLISYTQSVLTALGVKYGPCHTELMMTQQGPILIESAARLQGGILDSAIQYTLGSTQVTLTVDSLCNPRAFLEKVRKGYQKFHKMWAVAFISNQTGVVLKEHIYDLCNQLKSKYWVFRHPKEGEMISKTIDLFTSPGHMYLSHDNEDILRADYHLIRKSEQSGKLFIVR
jgi:L-amino acid ligase